MIIDLLDLKINKVNKIDIDKVVNIEKEYLENTDIKKISEVKLLGKILYHGEDIFEVKLNIKCNLIMECSVTLKDVNIPIDIDINENISYDEEDENNKIINNSIDLIPIVWQNIILEVPLKVVSDDVDRSKIHGDGWKLVTSEEELKENDLKEQLKRYLNE